MGKRHVMFWCSKEGMILLIAVSISTLYVVDRARYCIFLEMYWCTRWPEQNLRIFFMRPRVSPFFLLHVFIQALQKRLIPHPNNNGDVARFLFPRSPKPPPFSPQINRQFGTSSNNRKNTYRKMDFQCFQFSKRWELLPTQDASSSSFFGVCVFLCAKK